jgi:hypothetical protein
MNDSCPRRPTCECKLDLKDHVNKRDKGKKGATGFPNTDARKKTKTNNWRGKLGQKRVTQKYGKSPYVEMTGRMRVGIVVRLWGIPGYSPISHVRMDWGSGHGRQSGKKNEICGCEQARLDKMLRIRCVLPIPPCSTLPIVGSFDSIPCLSLSGICSHVHKFTPPSRNPFERRPI